MLRSWLVLNARNPLSYKFPVVDIRQLRPCDEDIHIALGNYLLLAHANPKMIKAEVGLLVNDLNDLNFDILKEYVEKEILPNKKKISTRIGNFGEVLSANLLVEFEGFEYPIYKLRLREKKDWAIRLTDICLVKKNRPGTPLVCYGEVKTKSNKVDLDIGLKGHESLSTDDALENAEILNFVCRWLYEMNKLEEGEFYSKIRMGKLKYDKQFELFIVHNEETWEEEILERLNKSEIDKRLVNFSVRIIYITDLRNVIDSAYEKCPIAAKDLVNG